jgi:hypothetical protein
MSDIYIGDIGLDWWTIHQVGFLVEVGAKETFCSRWHFAVSL